MRGGIRTQSKVAPEASRVCARWPKVKAKAQNICACSFACLRPPEAGPTAALLERNAEATLEAAPQFPRLGREVPFETTSDRIRGDDGARSTRVDEQTGSWPDAWWTDDANPG